MVYIAPTLPIPEWLPDDTEDSIVGVEWHQESIGALAYALRAVKLRRSATWGVCEQVELGGLRRPNGRAYAPRPDVMVLAQPLAGHRAAISLEEAGSPLFIAEVASSSTLRNDREGKRLVYGAIGVPEYVIFDPVGDLLAEPVEAWRLARPEDRTYVRWEPDADGYWRSTSLDIALLPRPPFLQVRDRDGLVLDTPLGTFERAQRLEAYARQAEQQAHLLEQQLQAAQREIDGLRRRLQYGQGDS
jgi:Uma2 family endonuclease